MKSIHKTFLGRIFINPIIGIYHIFLFPKVKMKVFGYENRRVLLRIFYGLFVLYLIF